jgi:hypothetical protein
MKLMPSRNLALAAGMALALPQLAAAVEDSNFRFDSTTDLYNVCAVAEGAAEYAVAHAACRAFIEAAVQYHDEISNRKNLKRLICYPATATIEDGEQAFTAWARAKAGDPKLMAEQPVVGLVRALAAKYPCPKG